MSKIIAITNHKGGVGKTTTAVNLSACLAKKGASVLLIDGDQQGNSTSGIGINKNDLDFSLCDVMLGTSGIENAIIKTSYPGICILPSNINLAEVPLNLNGKRNMESILTNELDYIREKYDFIIIDCPPTVNVITINCLVAADMVIIPIQCEFFALEGLVQIIDTIKYVQDKFDTNLSRMTALFTMFDARTNLSREVVETVMESNVIDVYATIIPRNIRLAEAPGFGQPITEYDAKSAGCAAYEKFTQEVIKETKWKKDKKKAVRKK